MAKPELAPISFETLNTVTGGSAKKVLATKLAKHRVGATTLVGNKQTLQEIFDEVKPF